MSARWRVKVSAMRMMAWRSAGSRTEVCKHSRNQQDRYCYLDLILAGPTERTWQWRSAGYCIAYCAESWMRRDKMESRHLDQATVMTKRESWCSTGSDMKRTVVGLVVAHSLCQDRALEELPSLRCRTHCSLRDTSRRGDGSGCYYDLRSIPQKFLYFEAWKLSGRVSERKMEPEDSS